MCMEMCYLKRNQDKMTDGKTDTWYDNSWSKNDDSHCIEKTHTHTRKENRKTSNCHYGKCCAFDENLVQRVDWKELKIIASSFAIDFSWCSRIRRHVFNLFFLFSSSFSFSQFYCSRKVICSKNKQNSHTKRSNNPSNGVQVIAIWHCIASTGTQSM